MRLAARAVSRIQFMPGGIAMTNTSLHPGTSEQCPRNSAEETSLAFQLIARFAILFSCAACILLVPAGTFRFWQGWAVLAAYFVPAVATFVYFYRHDPALVRRRIHGDESVKTQKVLIGFMKPFFIVVFLLPGFDFRWGWSRALGVSVPLWLEPVALATVVAGFAGVGFVLNTNRYAARTIRVEKGQTVISTGPYRWVRHPMYSASLVLWLATPIALGSWVALPAFALLIPLYVARLLNEEKVLRKELPGYVEYCQRTRYRLLPGVW